MVLKGRRKGIREAERHNSAFNKAVLFSQAHIVQKFIQKSHILWKRIWEKVVVKYQKRQIHMFKINMTHYWTNISLCSHEKWKWKRWLVRKNIQVWKNLFPICLKTVPNPFPISFVVCKSWYLGNPGFTFPNITRMHLWTGALVPSIV